MTKFSLRHISFLLCFFIGVMAMAADRKSGQVVGKIIDAEQNVPVAGALVQIIGDSSLACKSDSLGHYIIENVDVGYNILQVEADGYEFATTESFAVSTAAPAVVDIRLRAITGKELSEITVTASPYRVGVEAPVSMMRIGMQETDLTPGANRDISKVLQSMPGVLAVSNSNRNDLLVRGGGANENKYYIDGIEIPVLNHFAVQGGSGGNASLVNTELLRSTDFYISAFPVYHASGLSSVMEMTMLEGNREHFHGKVIVGFTDAGVHVNTPVSRNGNTTLTASWRTSYLNMLFSMLKLPFLPTYNDYQFKLTTDLSPDDKLYFIGLGSIDNNKLNTGEENLEPDREYILGYLPNNDQTSFVFGAGYIHQFDGGRLRATASVDYLKNRLYKYENNNESAGLLFDINDREMNYRAGLDVEWFDVGGFRLRAGASGGVGTSLNNSFGRYAIYASASRIMFGGRLSANVSLRFDGMSYSSLVGNPFKQVSPRLNLAWNISDKVSLTGSVARYYQEPSMTMLDYDGISEDGTLQLERLKYAAVNHYVLGVNYNPSAMQVLKAEGFYKKYSQLPVSLLDGMPVSTSDFSDYIVGDVPASSVGEGRAYGFELSWRHRDLWNTVVNASYTFVRSQLACTDNELNRIPGRWWSSAWDVRNIVTISAIHNLGRHWTIGAKWQFSGGLPFTPYDEEKSSLIEAWDERHRPYADNSKYNSGRNPAYHQLDIRVDKIWYFSSWRIGFYVDIQNIYDFSAKGQDILAPVKDENGAYVVDASRPGHYVMEHISHGIGGTILPTVGITFEF